MKKHCQKWQCFFCWRKEVIMAEHKTIYCPQCGRKLFEYNGKVKIPIDTGCKKCKKRIIYFPETDEIKITKIPQGSSSGTRVWF